MKEFAGSLSGTTDSAKLCYKQALEIFARIDDKKGMSACYNNLGLVSQETGKYNEALKYYQFSMEIDNKLGDIIGAALTKANCVDILIYQGNSKKALTLSNEVIAIYRNQSYKEGLMTSLINRAAIYDNLKQFDDAIADQEAAISLAKELKDSYHEAMAMSNMGLVTFHKGKPDEALTILNQALAMSDGDDNGYDILNTLWIMSEIYASKQEYGKSNDILQKLLKRFEVIDNKRKEAKVLTSLGRNLLELNEIDKAIGYLSKSLELTVEINAQYELLENYRNLAHANAILHNFSAADSLQDLFAETYSGLDNSDSLADLKHKRTQMNKEPVHPTSSASDWIIAFSLMLIVMILSVSWFKGEKDEA